MNPVDLLRPQSLGNLLDLIRLVMNPHYPDCILQLASPCEDLDLAQTILVRWGVTVSWCWSTWDDQRIANVEYITFFVSTRFTVR